MFTNAVVSAKMNNANDASLAALGGSAAHLAHVKMVSGLTPGYNGPGPLNGVY